MKIPDRTILVFNEAARFETGVKAQNDREWGRLGK